jgi:hypothetical protein
MGFSEPRIMDRIKKYVFVRYLGVKIRHCVLTFSGLSQTEFITY